MGFCSSVSTRRWPSDKPWLGVANSASPAEVRAQSVEESKAIVFLWKMYAAEGNAAADVSMPSRANGYRLFVGAIRKQD